MKSTHSPFIVCVVSDDVTLSPINANHKPVIWYYPDPCNPHSPFIVCVVSDDV